MIGRRTVKPLTRARLEAYDGRKRGRMRPHREPFYVRFWSNVDDAGVCWLWTGPTNNRGYGYVSVTGRGCAPAPRVAYALTRGDVPAGLFVRHLCDNPPCVRPDHLSLGTHEDNMADRRARGRVPLGEDSSVAKLTEASVLEARARYAAGGVSYRTLAADYGVTYGTIYEAVNKMTWTHIEGRVA